MKLAVVGAGLLGKLLAVQLSRFHQVDLYEQTSLKADKSAGYIAAAMLAPTAESVISSELVVELGCHSMTLWPEILKKLPHAVFYQQTGSLILAHNQDRGDLHSFSQRLKAKNFEFVTSRQITDLEPEIAGRFHQGLYLPTEGQLDNRALYIALNQQIMASQVEVFANTHVEIDGNTLTASGAKIDYDWIFDCRGIGAKPQIKSLRGVRGEVARVYAPQVNLTRPVRLMHPRYPIYIAPKPNNQYVIGATEIESESDKPVTVRSALELLSAAYSVHTGFAEAEILELESGLRPSLPDNEPKVYLEGNTIRLNGLYRHGYLLAPAIVEQALTLFNQANQLSHSYFTHVVELNRNVVKELNVLEAII
ncbi:glycine oxidase ThiO [Catenovulum maritimum]|uniref:glycine oxidase ThiO n=1 Tax=Catenovulum maritimum TaxID=1513271 RepID=UPI00097BFCF3|nr:glycine oxidase ThiO [Catenovulum maritimum]